MGCGSLQPCNDQTGKNCGCGDYITYGAQDVSFAQLMGIWIRAGGSPTTAAIMASVAMAESVGCTTALCNNAPGTTSSLDRGLWAMNSGNGSCSTFDIPTNARCAVQMSNNGTDFHPWCTAFTDCLCGTKGGYYDPLGDSCVGRAYRANQPFPAPDYSFPWNGTSAATPPGGGPTTAADRGGGTTGTLTGTGTSTPATPPSSPQQAQATGFFGCPWINTLFDPWPCWSATFGGSGSPCSGFGSTFNPICWVDELISSILSPLINIAAGIMGIVGGGAMMILGLLIMAESTPGGRRATATAGLFAIAPEAAGAESATSTTAATSAAAPARAQESSFAQWQRQGWASTRRRFGSGDTRPEPPSVQEQLDNEAGGYTA